ncbi:MAG TPA: hypothetical protein PKY59_21220 [Pyrinomonadaceae bacterium]|nr:hypothetical protein [Pyrinomonadaceae bacterium]
MNAFDEKEQKMKAYWLGELSEAETVSSEIEWFGTDEDAEMLEIVRADLIDDYLAETLNKSERNRFEKYFLLDNLEDVALAKTSLKLSREAVANSGKVNFFKEFFGGVRAFFGVPQIAAAVLLCGCVGLGFWAYFHKSPNEIAQNIEPKIDAGNVLTAENSDKTNSLKTPEANSVTKANSAVNNAENKPKTPANVNKNEEIEKRSVSENKTNLSQKIILLTAFRGGVQNVNLSDPRENVTLKLTMPGIDKAYKNYELRIFDAQNNLVIKQNLGNLSVKKSGETITMPALKGTIFKKNQTYKTALVGIDENKQSSELSSYDAFKIN